MTARHKPVTTAKLRELRQRHLDGEAIDAIVAEAGSSRRILYRKWKQLGLTVEKAWPDPKLSKTTRRSLWVRRCNGERTEDLAAAAGISAWKLREWWGRDGYDPSSQAAADRTTEKLDGEKTDRLWRRFLAGETSTVLAAEVGVSVVTLTDWWKREGKHPGAVRRARDRKIRKTDQRLTLALAGIPAAEIVFRLGLRGHDPTYNVRRSVRASAARIGAVLPEDWE